MDYMPPGRIVKVCDPRWSRWVIKDGVGQYLTADSRWTDDPAKAVLFCYEIDAVEERNRHCLGGEEMNTYGVSLLVTVDARRWSHEELVRYLKRHRKHFLHGPAGKEGILLEIIWNTLKKVE